MTIRSDGAELCNAALTIIAAYNNLVMPDGFADHAAAFTAMTEWCDWQCGDSVSGDCPEAKELYDAALRLICRWAGIHDLAGFRRYLQTRKGAGNA